MKPEEINNFTKLNSFMLDDVLLYVKQNFKKMRKKNKKSRKK